MYPGDVIFGNPTKVQEIGKEQRLHFWKRVLLPQPIESEAIRLLEQKECEIVLAPDPQPATVLPLMAGVHGLILRTGIHITRELLAGADQLAVISRTGGGLDNVDVAFASNREIIVTSNLGVNTSSVVEHVLALMLALYKKLFQMDTAVRTDNFAIRDQNLSQDLREKTLGIFGFGRIGSEVARICHAVFRMQIVAHDPCLPKARKEEFQSWVKFTDIRELFASSDVISIHVPLTDDTCRAVTAKEFSLMKPKAILINTSRGQVLDETALTDALQKKKIGGAGLDVFNQEPVPRDYPLLKMQNVILTPHAAALTKECVIRMAAEASRCVIDVFEGREPPNVANPQVLSTSRWKHLLKR